MSPWAKWEGERCICVDVAVKKGIGDEPVFVWYADVAGAFPETVP